jgi:hypothetical protein
MGLEIREHWKLWREEPNWRLSWMITDGLGEAGRDLKPNSAFLQDLNSHARRSGIHYTIIAGNHSLTSRLEADALDATASVIPRKARTWWGLRNISGALQNTSHSLRKEVSDGDGPVTLKSTRLSGVDDFVVLPVDHNMLCCGEEGQPPASWKIIHDRLRHPPIDPTGSSYAAR